MCGGKSDDDADLALEGQSGDVDVEKRCGGGVNVFFIILNIIVWIGSCALLAFGIFGMVDNPFLNRVMGRDMMVITASVLIIVGGIGFIISFMGCCGAITRSKCLIMTYVIILVILLAAIVIGGIISFLFSNRLEEVTADTMIKSLEKYDSRKEENDIKTLVKAWDEMQMALKCCGVMSYKDWATYNPNFRGANKIPKSCCKIDTAGQTAASCTSAFNQNDFFSGENEGCQDMIKMRLGTHAVIVGIVAAIVAFFMILGVILGITVYTRL